VPNANGITGSPTPEARDSDWVEPEHNQSNEASATTSALPHPWDQPSSESDSPQDEPLPKTPTSDEKAQSKPSLLPLLVAGAGLSLVVFSSSLYILTRPCVIGQCKAIPEAQELSQRSAITLQKPQSGKEILEAQQQLKERFRFWNRFPCGLGITPKPKSFLKLIKPRQSRLTRW
jgi:hypothetical protein